MAHRPRPSDDVPTMELVARASKGDQEAWANIFRRHRAVMRAMVSRDIPPELRPRLNSEDLLQSTFLLAFRHIRSFEYRGSESLAQWLTTILKHKLRERIRYHTALRRSVHRETPDAQMESVARSDADPEPAEISEIARRQADVLAAMDSLPERDQEILCLRFLDGLTWRQIAERLDVSSESVRRRGLDAIERIARAHP